MAKTLSLKFGLASGATRVISLSGAKDGLDSSAVTRAMTSMVSAGEAFTDALTEAKRAELIDRTVTVLVNNDD